MTAFQLNQQINEVLCFPQIFDAVFGSPAGDVLDHAGLAVTEVVCVDVLDRLDLQGLVMVAALLRVECPYRLDLFGDVTGMVLLQLLALGFQRFGVAFDHFPGVGNMV